MIINQKKVESLLQSGRPFRAAEAAWVLNVSIDKVYAWIDEGLLEVMPGGRPYRVSMRSVARMMQPVHSSASQVELPKLGSKGRTDSSTSKEKYPAFSPESSQQAGLRQPSALSRLVGLTGNTDP